MDDSRKRGNMNTRDLNNWGLTIALAVILAVLICAAVGR
jgi:hypothetical protein